MQGSRLAHAAKGAAPFPAKPFFDESLTAGEAAQKSVLGSMGIQSYGHTKEQLARMREEKKNRNADKEFEKLLEKAAK